MKTKESLLLFAAALAAVAAWGQTPDAETLIRESDERTKSVTERTTYDMELIDAAGKVEQTRRIDLFFKRLPDREVTLQKFLSPPVLEDTGMMIVDSGEATNDIWMYLPATRRLRRISGAEKSNWYMGTQFTYEDFEDYQVDAYDFTLRGKEACGEGARCWVVEAVPATEAEQKASGYTGKVYWLEEESLYPVRVDYLGGDGREVKRYTVSGLVKVGEYHRPREGVMEDLTNGRRTRLVVHERQLDEPLEDYYLSKRYLRED